MKRGPFRTAVRNFDSINNRETVDSDFARRERKSLMIDYEVKGRQSSSVKGLRLKKNELATLPPPITFLIPLSRLCLDPSRRDGQKCWVTWCSNNLIVWSTRGVINHLKAIDSKHHNLIRDKIAEQLLFEPSVETKNRKPLRQPTAFTAQWEIRFGPANRFRVLYDIDDKLREVQIVAIGEKKANCLRVGGEEIEL